MIDWTKPIQTIDGRKAEFVRTVKARAATHIFWCVVERSGFEEMASFDGNGQHFGTPTEYDIVNVPEEKVILVLNVYENGGPRMHESRFVADQLADVHRTHVVTIKRIGDEVTATVEKVQ